MIKKSLLLLSTVSLLSASTTMCYKKDHFDPDTIESIPLKGGKCDGIFSVEDMKKQGYSVSDIKISNGESGLNYIYVLEKEDMMNSAIVNGQAMSKEDLRAYLMELKKEEDVQKQKEERLNSIEEGKSRYDSLCRKCHGNGDIKAFNVAKPLQSLTEDQFMDAIRDFTLNERKGPMTLMMKPYADMITENDSINIYNYIQTLKK